MLDDIDAGAKEDFLVKVFELFGHGGFARGVFVEGLDEGEASFKFGEGERAFEVPEDGGVGVGIIGGVGGGWRFILIGGGGEEEGDAGFEGIMDRALGAGDEGFHGAHVDEGARGDGVG